MKKSILKHVIGMGLVLLIAHSASAQWVRTSGPDNEIVNALAVSGDNVFAGTSNGVFRSADSGTNWERVGAEVLRTPVHSFAVKEGRVFAGAFGGGVFISVDNGTSWTKVNSALTQYEVRCMAVRGDSIYAGSNLGVYRSTDNGASWNLLIDKSIPLDDLPVHHVYAVALQGGTILAGTEENGVFLSADNGMIWTKLKHGLLYGQVNTLLVNGNDIFAGTEEGLYRSTKNGDRWDAVDAGLANKSILSLTVIGEDLLAGTRSGVYRSTDNGGQWTMPDSSLMLKVTSFAVLGGNVFAGTDSNGVWRRPLSELTGSTHACLQRKIEHQEHCKINLLRSVGSIIIDVTTLHPEWVAVTLHDLAGRKIAAIVNRHLDSGTYRYSSDTRAMARGCYMMRMQTGKTTRMQLVGIVNRNCR